MKSGYDAAAITVCWVLPGAFAAPDHTVWTWPMPRNHAPTGLNGSAENDVVGQLRNGGVVDCQGLLVAEIYDHIGA